jgi:hypothetical protein
MFDYFQASRRSAKQTKEAPACVYTRGGFDPSRRLHSISIFLITRDGAACG